MTQQEILLKTIRDSIDFAEIRNSGLLPDPDGDDGYFFISYSHRDYKSVLADVIAFQNDGLKIWYDRGLESGKSWLSEVKKKISSYYCKGVIVYLSANYVASNSCMAELMHIAEQNKQCVFILLDDAANALDEELAQYVTQYVCLPFLSSKEQKMAAVFALPKPQLFEYYIQPSTKVNAFIRTKPFAVVKKTLDKHLRRVEIPPYTFINGKKYSVRGLGYFAFENCELLEEVSIPNGWILITENAFVNCPSLKKVDLGIPFGVFGKHLGILQHAFSGCENLREITCANEKISIMLHGTFSRNRALKEVNLAKGFCVDTHCFESCTTLERAMLHKKDFLDRGYVFSNCVSLKEVVIPHDNVSDSIGERTFYNCKKLKHIDIPPRVKNINQSAFEKCESLNEISLPKKIEFIDPTSFAECVNLKEVTVTGDIQQVLHSPVGILYLDEIFVYAAKFYSLHELPPNTFKSEFVQSMSDKSGYYMYVKGTK